MQAQNQDAFKRVQELLKGVEYKVVQHESCKTSEESAKVRGTPLEWGAKTMIVRKSTGEHVMLVYPANLKLSWSKVKKIELVGKKFQKADSTIEDILKVKQGGIPPFPTLFNMKGVIDEHLLKGEMVAFNAGMTTRSIIMKTQSLPTKDCIIADICEN